MPVRRVSSLSLSVGGAVIGSSTVTSEPPTTPPRRAGDTVWDGIAAMAERLAREEDLWTPFWTAVSPHLEGWASSPGFVGRLAVDDDHRREIVVQALSLIHISEPT